MATFTAAAMHPAAIPCPSWPIPVNVVAMGCSNSLEKDMHNAIAP